MDRSNNANEFTVQRRDTSVPVGEGSGRAGFNRPSSNDCLVPPGESQTGGYGAITGEKDTPGRSEDTSINTEWKRCEWAKKDEEEVFSRRNSLMRTPPKELTGEIVIRVPAKVEGYVRPGELIPEKRSRAGSLPDISPGVLSSLLTPGGGKKKRPEELEGNQADKQVAKRAKEEIGRGGGKTKEQTELQKAQAAVRSLIGDLARTTSALGKLVAMNKNTQCDIKKRVVEVRSQMDILTKRVALWEHLESEQRVPVERPIEKGDAQTQTEAWVRQKTAEMGKTEILERLKNGGSYQEFANLAERNWPKEAFSRVTLATRSEDPMAAPWDWDLALFATSDLSLKGNTERRFRSRYQGIEELRAQQVGVGQIAKLMERRTIPGKLGEGMSEVERTVHYLMAAESEERPLDPAKTFEGLKELGRSALSGERRKILLCVGERMDLDKIRKMTEFALAGMDVQVRLLGNAKGGKSEEAGEGPIGRTGRRKGPRDDAVLVKATPGRSYADLLRMVRKEVAVTDSGADVASIRKTRTGDLLVAVRRDQGKEGAKNLRKMIAEKVGEAKLLRPEDKRTTVHLSGLDGVTTKEEVEEAIRGVLPRDREELMVNALWPAFGDTQNASITMAKADATMLLRHGKIKVGWVSCRVRERKEVMKCFKCWGAGHMAADCTGPDRSRLCHRCGKEGHIAKSCGNSSFCPACQVEGHTASSTRCPIFRKSLLEPGLGRQQRRKEKEKES